MSVDASVISYIVKYGDLGVAQRAGVSGDDFVDEYRSVWRYLCRVKRDHDAVPTADSLLSRFPDLELPRVRKNEWPVLLSDLRKRRKFIDFLKAIDEVTDRTTSFDSIDDAIGMLQGRLNELTFRDSGSSHIRDLFSRDVSREMIREVQRRRSGQVAGLPTGLRRLDGVTGGLHKQKMVTVIGRSGIGKSWLDLLFVAESVIRGNTALLYPLEMSLFETAMRLYTIFTSRMFGADQALRNYDLSQGRVNTRELRRFLRTLEEHFEGRLTVADMGSLSDPYTIERIEAEVEAVQPDMFWVDYLTLLKPPKGAKDDGGYNEIMKLSHGIKQIAMRRNVVGGCSAQVNREAVRNKVFLPRLEHIAYGDSIGQDSDLVVSVNRKLNDPFHIYYALVKHRGGPEVGPTKVKFHVNEGVIEDLDEDADDA